MEKFKVVIIGTQPEADQAMAARNLSQLFKTDPSRIEALLQKPQTIIKTDLTKEAAEKYKTAIEKAGALAQVIPVPPAEPSSPDSAPGSMKREEDKEGKSLEPKATCPGCGYEATSSDDPLIAAHDGAGECPRCGVVPQKVIKAQEAEAQEDIPIGDVSIIEPKSRIGFLANPVVRVVIFVAVVLVINGGWFFFFRDKGPATAPKPKDVDKVQAIFDSPMSPPGDVPRGERKERPATSMRNVCFIPAGESRTITLTGPVPYVHFSEGKMRIKGDYGLALNEWEQHGIEVELINSNVFTDYAQVWCGAEEITTKDGETVTGFSPFLATGSVARLLRDKKTGQWIQNSPIRVIKVDELRRQGELTLGEAKKEWYKNPAKMHFRLEKKGITFYYFTVRFTVNVPSLDALQKTDEAESITNASLGIGPADLVFNNDDDLEPLVKGQGESQIFVRMDGYGNVDEIQGVRAELYNRDYTLTCE